jgi:S-formylglutathione hydrolase FrmB
MRRADEVNVLGDCTRRAAVVMTLAALIAGTGSAAAARPDRPFPGARPSADGSRLDHAVRVGARRWVVYVYSAAMRRVVAMQVIQPADTSAPAPTLYLLNGAEDGASPRGMTTWETRTDLVRFVSDKRVNVVTLIDGQYSYYTDWRAEDPALGRNRWQTFLTEELPAVMDSALGASGRNALAGVSMSATSVLQLAEAAPGRYRSVGSFSGCDDLATGICALAVRAVLTLGGVADPDDMWGPVGCADWVAHDPTTPANLAKLRGVNVVVAAGVPGGTGGGDPRFPLGGGPETVVVDATRRMQSRTTAAHLPVTYRYVPGGIHDWRTWQGDLHAAWPSFAESLGIPAESR